MKKTAFILTVVLIMSLLCACGSGSAKDPGLGAVADAVAGAVGNDEMMQVDANYIENMLKLSPDDYAECIVKLSNVGTNIDEFGIFKGADEKQAQAIETALKDYLGFRLGVWMEEYLPEEFPKLQNAEVRAEGNYVFYAIVGDDIRSSVNSAFADSFK